jgi:hypothetical protein
MDRRRFGASRHTVSKPRHSEGIAQPARSNHGPKVHRAETPGPGPLAGRREGYAARRPTVQTLLVEVVFAKRAATATLLKRMGNFPGFATNEDVLIGERPGQESQADRMQDLEPRPQAIAGNPG